MAGALGSLAGLAVVQTDQRLLGLGDSASPLPSPAGVAYVLVADLESHGNSALLQGKVVAAPAVDGISPCKWPDSKVLQVFCQVFFHIL